MILPTAALEHTSRATTPRLRALWADVANRVLAETGDEPTAFRKANVAVARSVGATRAADKAVREIAKRNRAGRKAGWLTFR